MSGALICPKGHYSTDSDYCSECGVPMVASVSFSSPSAAPFVATSIAESCPKCGTANDEHGRFCAVCRYDFQTKQAFVPEVDEETHNGDIPALTADLAHVSIPGTPVGFTAPALPMSDLPLELFVEADLSLATSSGLVPPSLTSRVFHLDLAENVVGRQADGKLGCPELVIADPGISRRHLKFYRDAAGSFFAIDLDSANGTTINGAMLAPGVPFQLSVGDVFVLGGWTRLTVRART